MPHPLVLIASLGRTDVQIVAEIDGRTRRASLGNRSQRQFHEDCRNGTIAWEMTSLEETVPLRENGVELRHTFFDYDCGTRILRLNRNEQEGGGPAEVHLAAGQPVRLCAPLLTQTFQTLRRLYGAEAQSLVRQVLLLTTCRENPPDDFEPVAAAHLVRAALADAFELEPDDIRECIYLTEREMYFTDRRYQQHLRYSAASRIDEAIKALHADFPAAMAAISNVGGIAEARSVVNASSGYRFNGNVLHLPSADRRNAAENEPGAQVLVPPAESLLARRQTRLLVEQGAFEAAARLAMPAPLEGSRYETEPWRKWLDYVSRLVQGDLPGLQKQVVAAAAEAKSIHPAGSAICGELQTVLTLGWILPIALRTECLLRQKEYSLALRESFTFLEALELRAIDLQLRRTGENKGKSSCISGDGSTLNLNSVKPDIRAQLQDYAWNNRVSMRDHRERMLELLEPGTRAALDAVRESLTPARRLRNAATHRVLTGADIETTRNTLTATGLWSESGLRFLGSSLVIEGLNQVGISDATSLFDSLTKAVATDMDRFSFQDNL